MKLYEGERCDVLDNNGRRCRSLAAAAEFYHGDGEISYPKVSWVRVAVCAKHLELAPFDVRKRRSSDRTSAK